VVFSIPVVVLDDVASFVVVDKVGESVAGFTVDVGVFSIPKVENDDVDSVVVVIDVVVVTRLIVVVALSMSDGATVDVFW
jgi:hypothetical protein